MPELRKDPIVGRWVIISTDRAKRPTDFAREQFKIKGGFCPFCYGNEDKTPPEIQAYRPNHNGGPVPQRDTPGWTVRVVPNKFPALGIEGNLNRQAEAQLRCEHGFEIVPGATHLFEEPGALEQVAALAARWFTSHLAAVPTPTRAAEK